MRAIFDFIKNTLRKIDACWIESAGHFIIVKGAGKTDGEFLYFGTPIAIYGFYDYPPLDKYTSFGIDLPDEMTIQINPESYIPAIGALINVEGMDWVVTQRRQLYNRFIGKSRMELMCQMYMPSTFTSRHFPVKFPQNHPKTPQA